MKAVNEGGLDVTGAALDLTEDDLADFLDLKLHEGGGGDSAEGLSHDGHAKSIGALDKE